jgi:hypothetical protein
MKMFKIGQIKKFLREKQIDKAKRIFLLGLPYDTITTPELKKKVKKNYPECDIICVEDECKKAEGRKKFRKTRKRKGDILTYMIDGPGRVKKLDIFDFYDSFDGSESDCAHLSLLTYKLEPF